MRNNDKIIKFLESMDDESLFLELAFVSGQVTYFQEINGTGNGDVRTDYAELFAESFLNNEGQLELVEAKNSLPNVQNNNPKNQPNSKNNPNYMKPQNGSNVNKKSSKRGTPNRNQPGANKAPAQPLDPKNDPRPWYDKVKGSHYANPLVKGAAAAIRGYKSAQKGYKSIKDFIKDTEDKNPETLNARSLEDRLKATSKMTLPKYGRNMLSNLTDDKGNTILDKNGKPIYATAKTIDEKINDDLIKRLKARHKAYKDKQANISPSEKFELDMKKVNKERRDAMIKATTDLISRGVGSTSNLISRGVGSASNLLKNSDFGKSIGTAAAKFAKDRNPFKRTREGTMYINSCALIESAFYIEESYNHVIECIDNMEYIGTTSHFTENDFMYFMECYNGMMLREDWNDIRAKMANSKDYATKALKNLKTSAGQAKDYYYNNSSQQIVNDAKGKVKSFVKNVDNPYINTVKTNLNYLYRTSPKQLKRDMDSLNSGLNPVLKKDIDSLPLRTKITSSLKIGDYLAKQKFPSYAKIRSFGSDASDFISNHTPQQIKAMAKEAGIRVKNAGNKLKSVLNSPEVNDKITMTADKLKNVYNGALEKYKFLKTMYQTSKKYVSDKAGVAKDYVSDKAGAIKSKYGDLKSKYNSLHDTLPQQR